MRKKAILPATTTTHTVDDIGVNQLPLEHLDFVWARVEGKPWMPGVVMRNILVELSLANKEGISYIDNVILRCFQVIIPDMEYGPQAKVRFIPPQHVLKDRKAGAADTHLVMLFDKDQSW